MSCPTREQLLANAMNEVGIMTFQPVSAARAVVEELKAQGYVLCIFPVRLGASEVEHASVPVNGPLTPPQSFAAQLAH